MKNYKRTVLGLALMLCVTMLPSTGLSADARISDGVVKTLVEREITRKGITLETVMVNVEDRVVSLTGTAASLSEREKLGRAAAGAYGVSRVDNLVEVRNNRSDEELAGAVRRVILTNPYYDIFDWIEGNVTNGVLTLTGAVREPVRKAEIERAARQIAGIREISNSVEVLPTSFHDDRLRAAAARMIYGNSTIGRYGIQSNPPIHIIVSGGRVTLRGLVANTLERQVAEASLSGLMAFGIQNLLEVESKS